MDFKVIYDETIAYFMTEYPTTSAPAKLSDCIKIYLSDKYTTLVSAEFLDRYFAKIRSQLVDEFNNRYDKKFCLRFRIIDAVGEEISGIGDSQEHERIQFQDAINELTPAEFEALSAYVLQICGCASYWRTPESHDQGIDAFGYMPFLTKSYGEWIGAKPRFIFLAQSKHYKKSVVGSKDIRELVGAYDLALYKIYSTVDCRYKELELLPFAPTTLILLTTEEVPHTVKRMSTRSGIVVLTSDDLYDLFKQKWVNRPAKVSKKWILKNIRKLILKIPLAT